MVTGPLTPMPCHPGCSRCWADFALDHPTDHACDCDGCTPALPADHRWADSCSCASCAPVEPMLRPGPCSHPSITDAALRERDEVIVRSWGGADHLVCPDCNEYLYPHDDGDTVTVYPGEPFGAGADPYGRPSPATHPEYWTE